MKRIGMCALLAVVVVGCSSLPWVGPDRVSTHYTDAEARGHDIAAGILPAYPELDARRFQRAVNEAAIAASENRDSTPEVSMLWNADREVFLEGFRALDARVVLNPEEVYRYRYQYCMGARRAVVEKWGVLP